MRDKSNEKLFQKLDEFNVEVPDFPMRKSRIEKMGDWLFDSTRLPEVEFTERGMVFTLFLPVLISGISAISLIFL